MFPDTGTLSFWLGIMAISLAAIVVLVTYLLGVYSKIEGTRFEKITEVGKWFIISVAIAVSAAIVADNFREREQDVKEMDVFDKYVSTIIEANGIEKRWLLAEYFSHVAPSGELRKAWSQYRAHIEPQLAEFRSNNQKIAEIASKEEKSVEEVNALAELQTKNAPLRESLINAKASVRSEWVIVAGTDISMDQAQYELEKARSVSVAARVYKVGNQYRTVIPGFSSHGDAERALPEARRIVNPTSFVLALAGWCSNPKVVNEDLIECS
jgi:hypothetical protein